MKSRSFSKWHLRAVLGMSVLAASVTSALAGAVPYVDVCGTVTVNGVPTSGVTVEAIRCDDPMNTVVASDITDGALSLNYHVVYYGAFDPSLTPMFGGYAPLPVYFRFSYPHCTPVIVSCADMAARYATSGSGKPVVNINIACGDAPGTATPGFWKNHPSAWPTDSITIGGIDYSKTRAIYLMGLAERGDKTKTVFRHLVSAKLNVLEGNQSSCVDEAIANADAWMAAHPVCSGVAGSSAAWAAISDTANLLDAYNNGLLCAPHRN